MSENLNRFEQGQSLLTVASPHEYAYAFHQGQQVEVPEESLLRGRILRGKSPDDFTCLAHDERKLVFTMGPDGLAMLPGKSFHETLATIGLEPDYVQGRLDQGFAFKLLIFRGAEANETPPATWDSVLDTISETYPLLRGDIERHRQQLAQLPFNVFVDQMSFEPLVNFNTVDVAGPAHPLFMSLERYAALPPEERDVLALRRLLVHEAHLGPRYAGDGYTMTLNGQRGMKEYVVPNAPVTDLREPVLVDFLP